MKKQKLRSVLGLKNSNNFTNDQNTTEHWKAKILKKKEQETATQQMTDVGEVSEYP